MTRLADRTTDTATPAASGKLPWYTLETTEVLSRLGTDAVYGLDDSEALERLERFGPNALIERGAKSPWRILLEQFAATMVVVLIVAAVVSLMLNEVQDAVVILVIVVLNAALGFTQEYRAEKAMAALKQLAVPEVRLRRGGRLQTRSARELVPGDVILLEAGSLVPADARILEAVNLRAQEAALTGESLPVDKHAQALPRADLPLGDRTNMVYMGTSVSAGRGLAVVTDTGMHSELGRLANLLQTVSREATPLQKRLAQLGRGLAVAAVALVAVFFVVGVLRGEEPRLMLLTALSLAVAVVPEGLPAVATITLALGAQRMLARRALIRKLPAVETLGSVTVICSDKTGTLTQNRMTVSVLDVAGHRLEVSESVGHAGLVFSPQARTSGSLLDRPALALLLSGGALCNDAVLTRVSPSSTDGASDADGFEAMGDPTEGALVVAAARFGLNKSDLETDCPRVAEVPFDSERKRMTTLHRRAAQDVAWLPSGATHIAFSKGAVEGLLETCDSAMVNGQVEALSPAWRERVARAQSDLAAQGMRVLGVAFRELEAVPPAETLESQMTFVGLIGMIDPPRPEVRQAVQTCKAAGIRPVMITGDHPLTALEIARELGITVDGRAVTGAELEPLSRTELEARVATTSVYARVSPEHKLRIVEALQARGEIVAMTGDGVNDAPALKKAEIGVAMGVTGTDVTKEVADMVLLDDNFATIVAAVEEGRVIFENIRKFMKYILTGNSAEIYTMLIAPFLGMGLPLLPLQILWINLVTDGLPGLALGVEPAERGTMRRPPHPPGEHVFSRGLGWHVLWVGLLMGAVSLGLGYAYWRAGSDHWRTMVFTTLALSQMAHVLAIRSGQDSLFARGLTPNRFLWAAVGLTLVLQIAVIYLSPLQALFGTTPLPLADLGLALVCSTLVFWAVELEKWLIRRSRSRLIPQP